MKSFTNLLVIAALLGSNDALKISSQNDSKYKTELAEITKAYTDFKTCNEVIKALKMPGDCAKQTDEIKRLHDDVGSKAAAWEGTMTPVPKKFAKEDIKAVLDIS